MVDDINKKIDGAPQNPEDSDNLFEKFRDHLGYLAKEVYETSRNAYDKALQSLEKWLSSQEKKVQKDVVDSLGKLRDTIDKNKGIESGKGLQEKKFSYDVPSGSVFSTYDRSPEVQESISQAAQDLENLVAVADKDRDPMASFIGKWMQRILATEK